MVTRMSVQIGAAPKLVIVQQSPSSGLPANTYVSETSPAQPKSGDFWFKPSENRLYAYVE